ncbi:class I SAM-dependent methyltransferase [Eubacteriales bacterium OttesenSCG-928-N13]|nr:class I SAM-dependent methyltransferase [Eubacteriales bacterium OttesenSCG-928-N13]
MSDHYYTQKPSSAHRPGQLEFSVLGQTMRFETDAGVFSRDGLDFGSRLLIESLPELHGDVLDMGCGWGAMGVTLAKVYPDAQFLLADINERAISLSQKNIALNGLRNAQTLRSDGFSGVEGQFDAIITNPPIRAGKQLIYALFDDAHGHLKAGGSLFIVIRKQQGAPSAMKHLAQRYNTVSRIQWDKGYWIIQAVRG